MKKQQFYKSVSQFFPQAALEYCYDLWIQHDFTFKVSKDRLTKLGDFRYHKISRQYQVSVNRGLNPYAFLLTYIHEVAHVHTYRQFKDRCKPHGREWQESFRQLAAPLLTPTVFPDDILQPLKSYLQNPAASTSGCMPLTIALRAYDRQTSEQQLLLAALETGTKFIFKNRTFLKIGRKRTRALCRDLQNGQNYLIPEVAQVQAVA